MRKRAGKRREKIAALRGPGGLAAADTPERIAKRIDRLSRYYGAEELPMSREEVPEAPAAELIAAAVERPVLREAVRVVEEAERPEDSARVVLEAIINQPDFVDIRYLEAGTNAARAVSRINVRDRAGRLIGYGTGSLVSPRLLLTNHHVLPAAEVAGQSAAEFNYQDGLDGHPLQPRLFRLDPATFFLADEERDFALVAVHASDQELAEFGFNRLIGAEGKAIVGECVTIVQHPAGEKKQVVLRENQIVDLVNQFLHYEADTERGSSGSPVFNDQWEIVALHHAAVKAENGAELGPYINEGIRISRIVDFIREHDLPRGARVLADGLLEPERISVARAPAASATVPPGPAREGASPTLQAQAGRVPNGIRVTIPLELTLGAAAVAVSGEPLPVATLEPTGAATTEAQPGHEAVTIDPDYSSRRGYSASFLGTGKRRVPLPRLPDELLAEAAKRSTSSMGPRHVFPYHHFSVVLNKVRRLAFFTAVNIDGRQIRRIRREDDRWFLDPRIPASEQAGEDLYEANDLDRGHLVRRLDPAWGRSMEAAKTANDDTFHFTNCTPQHKRFNQNKTTWAGLEDYILDSADNRDFKASVFTGPVLAEDDEHYRGVQLPRQFWKVAVIVKADGELSATGYLLSQEELIKRLEIVEEDFSYGAYRTYQVPVAEIEDLTSLSFGTLGEADPLAGLEATVAAREIDSPADLIL